MEKINRSKTDVMRANRQHKPDSSKAGPHEKPKYRVGFWKTQKISILYSFRSIPSKDFAIGFAMDILTLFCFLAIIAFCFIIVSRLAYSILPLVYQLPALKQSSNQDAYYSAAAAALPALKRVVMQVVAIFVSGLLAFMLLMPLLQGIAWSRMAKRIFSFRYWWKFTLVSLVWVIIWTAVFFALVMAPPRWLFFNASLGLLILLFLLYADPLMRAMFSLEKSIGDFVKDYLKTVFLIHHFIIYLLSVIIIYCILLWLVSLLKGGLLFVAVFLATSFMMSWSRAFMISLSQQILANAAIKERK